MMNLKEGLALAVGLMLVASAAFAESQSRGTSTFSSLSPGNQNIARALFYAQHPAPNGPQPLSMDQIATLKGHEGWGEVFNQMKAEGLVNEKNLGQVISSYEHHLHDTHNTSSNGRTIVTTGSGRSFASGSDHGNGVGGGSEGAEHGSASAEHGHDVTVSTAGGATNGSGASVASAGGGGSHGGGTGHAH